MNSEYLEVTRDQSIHFRANPEGRKVEKNPAKL